MTKQYRTTRTVKKGNDHQLCHSIIKSNHADLLSIELTSPQMPSDYIEMA